MSARARGFSLVELLISLVIGMISMLVVLQVFSRSEAAKRLTNGQDDAQLNAMLALNLLTRDARQAGWGLGSFNLLGCALSFTTGDGNTVTLASVGPITLNASLIPAGDAATDTVLVLSGSDAGSSEGDPLTATPGSTSLSVTTPSAFAVGDRVLAAPASRSTSCALTLGQVTAKADSVLILTQVGSGLAAGDLAYNLGASPTIRAYAVRNGHLTVCDFLAHDCSRSSYATTPDSTVWVPMASRVVSLRAQYARDTSGVSGTSSAMTGVVDTYDQTTPGSSADAQTMALQCRWARIIGLRLAVVGQSLHHDRALPTTAAPTWSGTAVSTASPANPTALPVSLTGVANWQAYRYRLMEQAVPLRNVIWQGSQATYQGGNGGC